MIYLFLFDLKRGKIIYSYDINEKISSFLNTKRKKSMMFNFLTMTNDDLMILLKNSFILKFDIKRKSQKCR